MRTADWKVCAIFFILPHFQSDRLLLNFKAARKKVPVSVSCSNSHLERSLLNKNASKNMFSTFVNFPTCELQSGEAIQHSPPLHSSRRRPSYIINNKQ